MDYQCIVVGAGPAGISCAFTLAEKGIKTLLLERGGNAGEKNVASTVLQTDILEQMIPNFRDDFPYERKINEFSLLQLNEKTYTRLQGHFGSEHSNCNLYTIFRSKFDRWFAQKAQDKGADLLTSAKVDELIINDGIVKGVRLAGEEIYSNIVVLADGIHSLLAEKAGIIPKMDNGLVQLGLKEVLELPSHIIEDRFQCKPLEGAIIHGELCYPFGDVKGSFTMYINRNSISLGAFAPVETLAKSGVKLQDRLDMLKKHPIMESLLKDSKLLEYQAHLMMSSAGRIHPNKTFGEGYLLCGDAGGFCTTVGIGIPPSMLSGKLAAEAVESAIARKDFSAASLSEYLILQKKTHLYSLYKSSVKAGRKIEKAEENATGYNHAINRMFKTLFLNGFICIEKPIYAFFEDLYTSILKDFFPAILKWPFDFYYSLKKLYARRIKT